MLSMLYSCSLDKKPKVILTDVAGSRRDSIVLKRNDSLSADTTAMLVFTRGTTGPGGLVNFAETLMGTRYVYGSSNPAVGFDCSGFITYVFKHFNITVPRSSIDFTNVGEAVPVNQAKKGDVILFTGTNAAERFVGHMGLVVSNDTTGLKFIHSSSGKAMGVTISPLDEHYQKRFVGVRRVFAINNKIN
ncbi:MAG: hypothetical protein JWN76_1731 [Chitinophagaceae bacterium]|nr:hypothetical protein [Chitinophagaceae bacterium]